ncbi:MAG: flagellar hook-associated protein 2 FliD [Gammaproteobacteria bacterium]|jgi:flagellar hook-associated protein 2|nr:flagellar hook-associated protein 2 FliD [Gammaproteobacteria bacterium]
MTTTSTSTPVSVASSSSASSAGGSVINVSSLVSQLVTATQAPQAQVITTETQGVTAQISALGTLKGALSTFQSSLSAIDTASAFAVQTANTSDKTIFTASADASAVAGSYNVTVSNLAQAQQLVSKPIIGGASAVVGTGSLSLTLGASSFSVTIDSTKNTVAGIAAAINSAAGNPGITATTITGTDGAHLVLSSSLTGASNTIQVSETDGGTAFSSLTYWSGNATNYTQNSQAKDASFSISGIPYTSPSNTVTSALAGVTLSLTGTTSAGANATLSVASDTTTIATNVSAFVSAYNTMQKSLASLGSYDASSGTAGAMLGDPLLQGLQSQIRQTLNSVVTTGSSAYNTLASVGITTNNDGTLSLNSAKLSAALATNTSAVSQLFGGTKGVAAKLNTQLTFELASTGPVGSRGQTLVKQENSLTKQQTDLATRMSALSASLTQQFTALDSLLSSLQTTSAYLSQAFASLPSNQGKSGG